MCDPVSAGLMIGGTVAQQKAQQDALDQQNQITQAAQQRQQQYAQQKQAVMMDTVNAQQANPAANLQSAADILTQQNQAAIGTPANLTAAPIGNDSARYTADRAARASSSLAEGMKTAALNAKTDALGKMQSDNAMGMADANTTANTIAGNAGRDLNVAQTQASAVQPDPLLMLFGGASKAGGQAYGMKNAKASGTAAAMV